MLPSSKFRARHLMPGPMDYMKNKIEQMRESLVVAAESLEVPVTSSDMSNSSQFVTPSQQFEDEEAGLQHDEALESSLLPTHKHDAVPRDASKVMTFLRQPTVRMVFTLIIYVVFSTTCAILSRFNLYQATYKFPYPLTQFFIQLVIGEACLLLWACATHILIFRWPMLHNFFLPPVSLMPNLATFGVVGPTSLAYLVYGSSYISCLEYLPLLATALATAPAMLIQLMVSKYFAPECTQSLSAAIACIVVMAGQGIVSIRAPGINTPGIFAGVVASIALPLHQCYLKSMMTQVKLHPLHLMHTIMLTCIVVMFPVLLISGELFEVATDCYFLDEPGFWGMMTILGVSGILTSASAWMIVISSSPLTMMVIVMLKNVLVQLPISNYMTATPFSIVHVVGMVACLNAALVYSHALKKNGFSMLWHRS